MEEKAVIGLDIGGTNIRIGARTRPGELICFEKIQRSAVINGENPGASLAGFIRDYLNRHGLTGKTAVLMAGFPATLSRDRRTILQTPNIAQMDQIPMADILEQALHLPVLLERDVNLLYEHDRRQLQLSASGIGIGIYFGTGIGNAIFFDGRALSGRNGCAGEIGHIPVIGRSERCGCGNAGCAECFASGTRLTAIQKTCFADTKIQDLFLAHGDSPVIREFVDAMACVVAAEANMLDPEHAVLGGGVPAMAGFPRALLDTLIREHLRKPFPARSLAIHYSEESQYGGVLGALALAATWLSSTIKIQEDESC